MKLLNKCLAMLALVAVYALVMMVVATTVLPGRGGFTQLAFYAVAGLAWLPPAMWLISWMHRPSR